MFGNQIFEKQFFFPVSSFFKCHCQDRFRDLVSPKAVATALRSLSQNRDEMPRGQERRELPTRMPVPRVDWWWLPGVHARRAQTS